MAVTTGVLASRIGGSSGTPYRYLAPAERQLMQTKWMGVSGQAPRGGKRPGLGFEVTYLTGPERWQVAPGSGVLTDGTGVAYDVSTTANAIEAFPTRPGAGTSRIDLLVLHILDAEVYSGETSSYQPQIELVSGTAAASPVAPTISFHNYILLATITMPTGSTAPSIVQNIPRTVAAGGTLPVATAAERTAIANPWGGLTVFQEDTKALWLYTGVAWSLENPNDYYVGSETAWKGSSPTAATKKVIQEFTVSATVTTGVITVTLPVAFANGITYMSLTPGSNTGGLGFFQIDQAASSLSAIKAYPWAAGSTAQVANATVVVAECRAVGW